MKKPLLKLFTGSFALASLVTIAQPTLTATGINPVIGENFTLNNSGYVSPGSSGAGQTWDLSAMSGSSGGVTNVAAPSATTNGTSFTSANVALDNSSAGTDLYFKTTSSVMQSYGLAGGGVVIPYSNPEDFLHFPFAFNNTYTDPFVGQFTSSGFTFYRKGTVTVTADGYGTLTTPTGTYNNVIRIHFAEAYQDSANFGTPYIITYINDEYMWYKEGAHIQIAAIYTLTPSAGSPSTGGTYVTGTVGIEDASGFISSSDLFPNPAVNNVTLNFSLSENKKVNVKIVNELGQQAGMEQNADGIQGENSIQLNIAALPEGIYFTQIILDGNIASTKRFVVSK